MRSWFDLPRGLLGGLLLVTALAGCSGLEPAEPYTPITDPAQLYLGLRLNHRAVNLSTVAPDDTLRLTATPMNGAGQPLGGLPAPTFRSSDTTRVWVSPDGLLRARRSGTEIQVIAELVTEGNLRHADTAFVNVTTQTPPTPASLVLDLVPPDGAVWGMLPGTLSAYVGGALLHWAGAGISFVPELRLTPRVLAVSGTAISGLVFEYESLDPAVVKLDRWGGYITGPLRPGQARLVVRSTAYGVPLADTLVVTATLPVVNGVAIEGDSGQTPLFTPSEVVVRRNGYVFWANLSWDSVEVTFDDPTNVADIPELCAAVGSISSEFCLAGNVSPIAGAGGADDFFANVFAYVRGRRFPVPGTYTFRSTRTGNTGRVVVLDE